MHVFSPVGQFGVIKNVKEKKATLISLLLMLTLNRKIHSSKNYWNIFVDIASQFYTRDYVS